MRPRRATVARVVAAVTMVAALCTPAQAAWGQLTDAEVRVTKGIEFGRVGDRALTLNLYQPKTNEPGRPAVLLVHGGSWSQGDPDRMDEQGRLLARQGWVGISITYRLSSRDGPSVWPGNLDDVRTAVSWVAAHAREYDVDVTRLALIGESAGGHLSGLVATRGLSDAAGPTGQDALPPSAGAEAAPTAAGAAPAQAVPGAVSSPGATAAPATPTTAAPAPDRARPPRIRAVALWSAPLDMTQLVPNQGSPPASCGDNEACKAFWKLPLIPNLLGCNPDQCPDTYRQASPTQLVGPKTIPMYVANSTDEIVPWSQADAMNKALEANSVAHRLFRLDGNKHGIDYTSKVWNDMIPFLANQLGVPVPQPVVFNEPRSIADYFVFAVIGIFAVGMLVVFIWIGIRRGWDEPT